VGFFVGGVGILGEWWLGGVGRWGGFLRVGAFWGGWVFFSSLGGASFGSGIVGCVFILSFVGGGWGGCGDVVGVLPLLWGQTLSSFLLSCFWVFFRAFVRAGFPSWCVLVGFSFFFLGPAGVGGSGGPELGGFCGSCLWVGCSLGGRLSLWAVLGGLLGGVWLGRGFFMSGGFLSDPICVKVSPFLLYALASFSSALPPSGKGLATSSRKFFF